jgi:hypothetical protein
MWFVPLVRSLNLGPERHARMKTFSAVMIVFDIAAFGIPGPLRERQCSRSSMPRPCLLA